MHLRAFNAWPSAVQCMHQCITMGRSLSSQGEPLICGVGRGMSSQCPAVELSLSTSGHAFSKVCERVFGSRLSTSLSQASEACESEGAVDSLAESARGHRAMSLIGRQHLLCEGDASVPRVEVSHAPSHSCGFRSRGLYHVFLSYSLPSDAVSMSGSQRYEWLPLSSTISQRAQTDIL